MEKLEDILDKALLELKQGTPKEVIVSKWPEHSRQLAAFLAISEQLTALPKNNIPSPVMQRKYLHMPIKNQAWFAWVHMSRFVSVSMASLLLIAGFAATAYGAAKSLPGQILFPLRKTAEQLQLDFASNDIQRANIQLKITKQRLADAQEVFSSPGANPEQQVAALNELTSQTSATLQTVQSVASSNNPQTNSPLVASLNNISDQQQALLQKITSTDQSASATGTSAQAVALNQFKLVAANTNEQSALISLNPDADSVVTTQPISYIGPNDVIADGTTFSIDSDTFVKAVDQQIISFKDLKVGDVVTIIGGRSSSGAPLTAKEILVTSVQGASTTATGTTSTLPSILTPDTNASSSSSTSISTTPSTAATSSDTQTEIPIPTPSQAIGTFIPESPAPQFKP